MITYIKKTD